MRISLVTPSFNQAQFIEQTIDSVLSQNYPSLDYIIIDGGSEDGSMEIIKKYERYLTYWVSEKDRGQSHAINKGYGFATGEVFNWLNSDDFLKPNALQHIAERFKDPSVSVVLGWGNIIQEGKQSRLSTGTDVYDNNLSKTLGYARIDQPQTWFRKKLLDRIMPLNENLHYVMDKDMWMRYLLTFGLEGIVKMDEILINFRLHESSKTSSQQSGFLAETGLLFHALAKSYHFNEEADFIQQQFQPATQLVSFPKNADPAIVKQALHYFLLYKADSLYYFSQYDKARTVLAFIQPELFAEGDLKVFKRLQFRSAPWVQPFVNQIRKWK